MDTVGAVRVRRLHCNGVQALLLSLPQTHYIVDRIVLIIASSNSILVVVENFLLPFVDVAFVIHHVSTGVDCLFFPYRGWNRQRVLIG